MAAYIARRILLIIPTLLGILTLNFIIIQFAPGGPVERAIAQMSGMGNEATQRVSGSDASAQQQDSSMSAYRGAQGVDPKYIHELEKQFGFDKPPLERYLKMLGRLRPFRLRQELLSGPSRRQNHRLEDAGLNLDRPMDDVAYLS